MEAFHYLSNQLKGKLTFQKDQRKFDVNKENELLSSTNNVTIFKAVLNSSVRFDENGAFLKFFKSYKKRGSNHIRNMQA